MGIARTPDGEAARDGLCTNDVKWKSRRKDSSGFAGYSLSTPISYLASANVTL